MAYTDIDNGCMTCDQVNQNVAQTVRMTVRAPRIANRLFETLEQAQAFVDHVGDTATATRGLILSVFDDNEEKNGLYQVEAVAINPGEVGRLKKICSDTGLQILHVVDIDTDLAGYKEESIYMCIVDRSADGLSSLTFVFEVNDQQTQILWGHNGYYMRSYNTVNDEWGPWKWYGYVDGYHTHKSEDITDSVSSLPVRVEDREKLIQAGAVEKYIKDLGQGNAVPTVDHKLIYSEDNKSLIAKEFMLPYVYVVDNAEDVDKCKSPVPAITDTTDVLSTWRAYSNSQNMPEYGGGISFEPDTYTPVGYSQGYRAWSQNKQLGYIRSDNIASEHNGYINIDASDNIRFEAVLGIEDNAPSNRTPNTVTTNSTSSMGIWLVAGEDVEARYVEKNGKKYYRDSTKDTAEGSRETGTNWRAWVCEDDQEDILYGDYVNIHTVSGGTDTFTASGDAYTKDAAPDGTTLHEASGALSMLCINFDNHDFNTISIGARSYDVSGQTIVGGAYCPISRDRGRVTYIGNEEENLVDSAGIITSNEALNMVPYDFSGDSAGMSSFVKALIEYSGSTLTIKFTDIAVCNTGDKDVTLANAKNWAYNGSSVKIDFVNKTYTYTDKFGNTSDEEELPDDFNWEVFSGGKLRIMYQAIGLRGSLFMSTKSPQLMNIILNTADNTVTRFNEETWQYETYGGDIKDLIDIMHGSHMAYNDITKKLWYSNGTDIYPISAGSEMIAGSGITISEDGVISAEPYTAGTGLTLRDREFSLDSHQLVTGKRELIHDEQNSITYIYDVMCELNGQSLKIVRAKEFYTSTGIWDTTNGAKWTKSSITSDVVYCGLLHVSGVSGNCLCKLEINNYTTGRIEVHNVGFCIDTPSITTFSFITSCPWNIIARYGSDSHDIVSLLEVPSNFIGSIKLIPVGCETDAFQMSKDRLYVFTSSGGIVDTPWNDVSSSDTDIATITKSTADNFGIISDSFNKPGGTLDTTYKCGKISVDMLADIPEPHVGDYLSDLLINDYLLHYLTKRVEALESKEQPTVTDYLPLSGGTMGTNAQIYFTNDDYYIGLTGNTPQNVFAMYGYGTVQIRSEEDKAVMYGKKDVQIYSKDQAIILDAYDGDVTIKEHGGSGSSEITFSGGNGTFPGKVNAEVGFFETSDIRKKNITGEVPLNKAYELIDKCSAILYTLKDNEQQKEQIGLIAQEVEEFFPEIVATDADGFKSLDYSRLSVILLKVLKDLIKRVSMLESHNVRLC